MKKLLFLFLLLIVPQISHAAIAQDGAIVTGTLVSGTQLSYSFTVNTTGDAVIVQATDGTHSLTDDINTTNATWNGAALTLIAKVVSGCVSGNDTYLFKLTNASAGTGNVVINTTGAAFNIDSYAQAYSGTDKTNAVDAFAAACDANAPTPSLTASVAGDWYVSDVTIWNSFVTAIAGATRRGGASNFYSQFWDSSGSVGAVGSHSFAYTAPANSLIEHIDILLKPAATTAASFSFWQFFPF